MDFQNLKFRATLFTDNDIAMDEQWFAEANKLMAKFNLVPSVGSAFKIVPSVDGGVPSFINSYFIEFKKLDNSFRVSFMPNRFDVEKQISSPSIASPMLDFVKEAIDIFDGVSSLQNTFSRVALAVNIDLSISGKERESIVTKLMKASFSGQSSYPSELFKRMVFKIDYKFDNDSYASAMNEVFEVSSPNISNADSPLAIGFDFNSTEKNSVDEISDHYKDILYASAENIVKHAEVSCISKMILD